MLKTVQVVASIITDDARVLATQRGYGEQEGGWEFPGGKVEEGETPREALVREIREELNCQIEVGEKLVHVEHDYEKFHLSMGCYLCTLKSDFELTEHHAAKWVDGETIDTLDWLPADVQVVQTPELFS